MGDPALLGIVVVNYGSHDLLREHLGSVAWDAVPARVVVVDNFTSAAEVAAVETLCRDHGWELVALPRNVGFGEACNRGATSAFGLGCDVVMLLNPDAELTASAAATLAARSRNQPRSIVAPVILRADGSVWSRGSRLDPRTGRVGAARGAFRSGPESWLTGACLVIHRSWWAHLGGFTGDYFLYWEDVDLSRRCVDAGGSLVLAEDVVATHDVGGTQGTGKSAVYLYYNCRNRLVFAGRHLPTRDLLRWILHTPAQNLAIMRRDGFRSVLASPDRAWAGIRGSAAGLAIAGRALVDRMRSAQVRRPSNAAA